MQVFENFCHHDLGTISKKTIKVVGTDNGMEFVSLKNYFDVNGISLQTSVVGTPQQNGRMGVNIATSSIRRVLCVSK